MRILVPVDFSPYSVNAFKKACHIASCISCQIALLHVIQLPYSHHHNFEETKKRAYTRLNKLVSSSLNTFHGNINIHIQTGLASPAILQMARKIDCSMIILGRKGETESDNLAVGSIAKDVVLHAKTPVMLVSDSTCKNNSRRFLFTTVFHPKDSRSFQKSARLAEQLKANIRVLHVSQNETGPSTKKELETIFQNGSNVKVEVDSIHGYDILNEISDYIRNQHASMLILTRYKKSELSALNHKKPIQKLLENTNIPVLIFAG